MEIKTIIESLANQLQMISNLQQKITPAESEYLYNLGVQHFQAGDIEKAQSIFQMLTLIDLSNHLYYKSLAGCQQELKHYIVAIHNYRVAWQLQPEKNADCIFFIGVCLFKLQQCTEAKAEFEKYLNLVPNTHKLVKRANLYLTKIEKSTANSR